MERGRPSTKLRLLHTTLVFTQFLRSAGPGRNPRSPHDASTFDIHLHTSCLDNRPSRVKSHNRPTGGLLQAYLLGRPPAAIFSFTCTTNPSTQHQPLCHEGLPYLDANDCVNAIACQEDMHDRVRYIWRNSSVLMRRECSSWAFPFWPSPPALFPGSSLFPIVLVSAQRLIYAATIAELSVESTQSIIIMRTTSLVAVLVFVVASLAAPIPPK
jgi:hypothetical protein